MLITTQIICQQYGYDLRKKKVKRQEQEVEAMEDVLRACINEHSEMLLSWSADKQESRQQFIDQIMDITGTLDTLEISEEKKIKLVSIDVDKKEIRNILRQRQINEDSSCKRFLTMVLDGQPNETASQDDFSSAKGFVGQTHVTMAHFGSMQQSDMRSSFGALRGNQVKIKVKGLLWSKRVAAFAVDIAAATSNGLPLPTSTNGHPHITIWFCQESSAFEANQLPKLVELGEAQQDDFENPITLTGTLSFWGMNNQPFKD
jgi:hypothetical protein